VWWWCGGGVVVVWWWCGGGVVVGWWWSGGGVVVVWWWCFVLFGGVWVGLPTPCAVRINSEFCTESENHKN
jgi:hypothetical protein